MEVGITVEFTPEHFDIPIQGIIVKLDRFAKIFKVYSAETQRVYALEQSHGYKILETPLTQDEASMLIFQAHENFRKSLKESDLGRRRLEKNPNAWLF